MAAHTSSVGAIEYIEEAKWYFHPDNKIDVAVMPYAAPGWALVHYLPSQFFATDYKVESKNFGTGDMAYVVGIFQKMRGKERNLPFVHTGHIASMGRGEKVVTEDWRLGPTKGGNLEIEGYLVQAPTLPESSGSPVFVRRTLEVGGVHEWSADGKNNPIRAWTHGTVWLLGLWHGAWETEEQQVIVGTGIGLCVPVPRILETLDRDDLKEMRKAVKAKTEAISTMKPQSKSSLKNRTARTGARSSR